MLSRDANAAYRPADFAHLGDFDRFHLLMIEQSDVSASKRYWAEDIVGPEISVTSRGTIIVRMRPGEIPIELNRT